MSSLTADRDAMTAEGFAVLREQVRGITSDHHDLRDFVGTLSSEMRGGFAAINAKLDTAAKTPWGLIFSGLSGVLAICVVIGGLAYAPIKGSQDDLKNDVKLLMAQSVPRVEHERVWSKAEQDTKEANLRLQRVWDVVLKQAAEQAYLNGQLHPLK